MQKPYDGPNRRRVFRLHLPADSRLTVRIDGQEYQAVEVAEYSLVVDTVDVASESGICQGEVVWSDGRQSEFRGEIGRLKGKRRVIWKIQGIEMQDVISEQRRLLAKQTARRKAA